MSLRSPTENEITLTPGSSPGQALALSPFDDAQGRRSNGRGNFFRTTEHQTRFFFLPSPACGRGEGEGPAEYNISKENAKGPDMFNHKLRALRALLRKYGDGGRRSQVKYKPLIVSFQHGVLESRLTWMSPEASVRTWMPAIQAGMTENCFF